MTRSRREPRPLTIALERIQSDLAPQTLLASAQLAWREAVDKFKTERISG